MRVKGAAGGDTLDSETEAALTFQIAQETIAREMVRVVLSLSLCASAVHAKVTATVADSPVDCAEELIDSDTVMRFHSESIALQDDVLGRDWSRLVANDLVRFLVTEKMSEASLIVASTGLTHQDCLNCARSSMAWIEADDINAGYPALADLVKTLQSLPFQLNGTTQKINDAPSLADLK